MTAHDSSLRPGVATLTVALCYMIAVFEGFDLQAAGVAAPQLAPALDLTKDQLSWFFSSSTFGMLIGASAGGWLSDRFGRKRVLIGCIVIFGAMSVLTGLSQTYDHLLATRFLTGVGMGGALPNLVALTSENAAPGRRNTAVGLLYAGLPSGAAIASLISVFGAAGDWRLVFFIGGVAPLVAVPLLMFVLPESRQLQSLKAAPQMPDIDRRVLGVLFGSGRASRTLLLWTGFFLMLVTMYLLLNWLPTLLVDKGLSRTDASWAQTSFNVFGVVASLATGVLMDRLGLSKVVVVVFGSAGLALWLLAGLPPELALAIGGGGFAGMAMSGAATLLYAVAPSNYPTAVRGTGVGAAFTLGRFGSATGPLLAGALVAAGWSASGVLTVLIPVVLAGGLATLLLTMRMSRLGVDGSN